MNDFVVSSADPNPTTAEPSSGRTYRVVRGNNQPDEILEFDWHTAFGISVALNGNATSDDVDIAFPVTLTSASLRVQQASGGIVNPPTTGTEYYDSVTSQVNGNLPPSYFLLPTSSFLLPHVHGYNLTISHPAPRRVN